MSKPDKQSEKLDRATDKALDWCEEILDIKLMREDMNWIKIQQLKAQAAALVGQLKARVDPAAMRGGKGDRVGEVLAGRLDAAKKA